MYTPVFFSLLLMENLSCIHIRTHACTAGILRNLWKHLKRISCFFFKLSDINTADINIDLGKQIHKMYVTIFMP